MSNASAAMYLTWSSPALLQLTSDNSPIGVKISEEEGSWVASSFLLGSVPGCFFAVWSVEKLGRKAALLISALPLGLSWFAIAFTKSVLALCILRFIAGMALAIVITGATTYNGEIADKDIRGKLGTTFNILRLVGSLYVLCVGPFVSYKALALSCSVFPITFAILFYFMPESPYFLVKVGKKDAARDSLIRLLGNNTSPKAIEERLIEIESLIEYDMRNRSTLWEFLSKEEYRRSLIIIIGVKSLQQLSGATAIDSYTQTIIETSGSSISSEISSIIAGLVQLPAAFLAAVLVDRMGRKPLMIISALGCATALIAEGVYFYLYKVTRVDVSLISWLPTASLVFYLVMNPLGVFTLPYVLLGELFATNIKGIAVSSSQFYGGILGFLVIKFFQPISSKWGMHTSFWIFAAVCIVGAAFCFLMQPETKGKTFAEIQEKLNNKRKLSIIAACMIDTATNSYCFDTATMSMASAAMYLSWSSPALLQLTSDNSPIGIKLTAEEGSWVASSATLGTIIGCLFAVWLVNKFGCKTTLLISALPLGLPWFGIAFARSVLVLCTLRFIAGIGLALVVTGATTYIGEVADKDIRGRLGTALNILKLVGTLYVLCVGPFVSYEALALSCSVLPITFAIIFYFMPESPYYLIKVGRKDAAKENLIRLLGNNTSQTAIEERLLEIELVVKHDMKNRSTLWAFLSSKKYRNSLIIIIGVKTLQQLSGATAIDSYTQTIIEASGSSISSEISSIIAGLVQLPAAFLAAGLVDRMGRKPLMIISALGCATALIAEGVYFYLYKVTLIDVSMISWLPAVALVFYLVMNPLGVFTLPYVLLGELFATNIKGIAVSFSHFYGSIIGFLVIKFFQPISIKWGMHTTFWIFATACILGATFCFFVQPETKGKTFTEIQDKLNRKGKYLSDKD
ncbi:hypothetical protein ILUMI_11365 [Ignelater luminosus]|uniref:Major facilitator superfamily (MFS) profile domain-containing protein n=1 Tax=Ignelater luminosus TaxID=2038154 RepID=A0A8K0GE05_IGNLU|nr:hypothetical protein ILUMI_11365 [Ignelater luminosus]